MNYTHRDPEPVTGYNPTLWEPEAPRFDCPRLDCPGRMRVYHSKKLEEEMFEMRIRYRKCPICGMTQTYKQLITSDDN